MPPSTICRTIATHHMRLCRLDWILLKTQLGASRCPCHIEVYQLLPAEVAGASPTSPLVCDAERKDRPIDNESHDCLPPHRNIFQDGAFPTSSNTSSNDGYVHLSVGFLRGLSTCAIRYAAQIWKPLSRFIAAGVRSHISLLVCSTTYTVAL